MRDSAETHFDFDTWSGIAKEDPGRFEELRHHAVEQVIANVSEPQQQQLRCLQWRID